MPSRAGSAQGWRHPYRCDAYRLAERLATEPDRTRAAAEQAWDAACDYLASRNWEDMTRWEAYSAALLKAWNSNPHRRADAIEDGTVTV